MSGALVLCGTTLWDWAGRKGPSAPKDELAKNEFPAPHRLGAADFIRASKVYAHCTAAHAVVIDDSGNAYTFGRNQNGQLGDGTTVSRTDPFKVSIKGEKFIDAAVGRNHTILVAESGRLYAAGDNKLLQLGIEIKSDQKSFVPTAVIKGQKFVTAACGADYTVAVTDEGALFAWGSPQYGQLGDGSDHCFIAGTNRMTYEPQLPKRIGGKLEGKKIVSVSCGNNHTVALDDTGAVFSWGAGGYGRLGHGTTPPKDTFEPTEVPGFKDRNNAVKSIACGPTCCMAIDSRDALHMWGKWRLTGDGGQGTPWLYPKHYQGLSGWAVREISAGFVTLFALAEQSTISWGQNATHGELGHGKNKPKSATNAAKVEDMEDIPVFKIACGLGFSLMIADRNAPKFASLPVIDQLVSVPPPGMEPDADAEDVAESKPKAARGKSTASKSDNASKDARASARRGRKPIKQENEEAYVDAAENADEPIKQEEAEADKNDKEDKNENNFDADADGGETAPASTRPKRKASAAARAASQAAEKPSSKRGRKSADE